MEWKRAVIKEGSTVEIPERWLHLYFYEALNILFRFENSLRVFVYVILKKEFGEKWLQTNLSSGGTIGSETKKRIKQSQDYGYLGYEVSSPMLFLNSGELIDIIGSEACWKHFAKYFKASKSIILTKLQEIGTIRNSLAHFRPIKEDDIDLIKQNTKHVLCGVERCLEELTSLSKLVPTNCDEDWYKKIKPISSENIYFSLYSGTNTEWIRIAARHRIPTFSKSKPGSSYMNYTIGKLRILDVIRNYGEIRNSCIYVSEQPVYGSIDKNFDIKSNKDFSFVFAKQSLIKNLDSIVKEFGELVSTVDDESQLLQEDNLARGTILETTNANAYLRNEKDGSNKWSVSLHDMDTPVSESSEVEFWGSRWNFEQDFISASAQYPWMPSSISKEELPF